jgi:glc operon protein GlcG
MSSSSVVQYGVPIGLDEAKRIVAASEREASANGFAAIIAVVDSAAELVMLERMDHGQYGSIDVAISKARTAVRFKRPTKAVEDALAQGGVGLRLLTVPDTCAIEGGIPLIRDGKIIGGIGVSGMMAQQDGQIAAAGAAALATTAQT